jgi:hypothetical protein
MAAPTSSWLHRHPHGCTDNLMAAPITGTTGPRAMPRSRRSTRGAARAIRRPLRGRRAWPRRRRARGPPSHRPRHRTASCSARGSSWRLSSWCSHPEAALGGVQRGRHAAARERWRAQGAKVPQCHRPAARRAQPRPHARRRDRSRRLSEWAPELERWRGLRRTKDWARAPSLVRRRVPTSVGNRPLPQATRSRAIAAPSAG